MIHNMRTCTCTTRLFCEKNKESIHYALFNVQQNKHNLTGIRKSEAPIIPMIQETTKTINQTRNNSNSNTIMIA